MFVRVVHGPATVVVEEKKAKPTRPTRVIELDFVRGIAILLVMNHHFNNDFADTLGINGFGWCGVSLFFVLSGFLVGGLLIREWRVTKKLNGIRFLKRRALKIWPAYYFYVLFAVVVHTHPLNTFLIGNLLNIQNYTGTSLSHTWSLAVEEHFYLLLTILLIIAVRNQWAPKTVLITCIAVAVAVATLRTILQYNGITCHQYTHCQMDALLLGVILALLYNYWPDTFAAIQARKVALWTAFAICFAWLLSLQVQRAGLSYLTIIFTDLGCACFLLLMFRPETCHARNLPYRWVALIGTYSYGIYLWHLAIGLHAQGLAHYLPASLAPWYSAIVPMVLAIAFGAFMTKLIEFPFLKLRDRIVPSPHGSHLLPEPKEPRSPDHAW